MKKLFFIFAILLGTCLTAFAQNLQEVVYLKNGSIIKGVIIEQTPNESLKIQTSDGSIFAYKMTEVMKITKESNVQNKQRKRYNFTNQSKTLMSGYKGFVDLGYGFGVGDYGADKVEFLTSHGYQFNPYIFVGLGSGINYYTDGEIAVVPIFADIKGTLLNNHITPFLDLKIGYSFLDIQGFYMNPSIGCRFGLGRRIGLNVSLGYSMQKATIITSYMHEEDITIGGINLKFGIDF